MHSKILKLSFLIIININLTHALNYTDTLKVLPFDPVVVTGTRVPLPVRELPLSISIIDERILQANQHRALYEILAENVPGLFITQRTNLGFGVGSGSGGQINLRGLGGTPNTQVLVLIDGRPDVMGLFGHPLSDVYFLQNVRKIEVIRGPSAVLYGSNAMGGAVNIITDHKPAPGLHFEVPLHIANYRTRQIGFSNQFQHENWGYSAGTTWRQSAGYRTDGRDDYESLGGNAELHAIFTKTLRLTVNGYFANLHFYDPGQVTSPFSDHVFNLKRRGGDLSINHLQGLLTTDLKLHYNAGHHRVHDPYFYESYDQMSGFILNETIQITDAGQILVGFDWRLYGGRAWIGNVWKKEQVSERSVLAQGHWKPVRTLNLTGGLRYSHHSVVGEQWVPALGATILLPADWLIKAQYSQGFRNPTINELFLFTPSTTALRPEKSRNQEFCLEKSRPGIFRSTLTVFQVVGENLIQKNVVAIAGNFRPLYQNTGKVKIQGIEWDGLVYPIKQFCINYGGSWSTFSRTLVGYPEKKVDLGGRWQLPAGLGLRLHWQWVSGLYSVENPYSYTPPVLRRLQDYTVIGSQIGWTIRKNLELAVGIENLGNVRYETMYGFPMPGRNVHLELTFRH